jgi:dephospho-CoA kinase
MLKVGITGGIGSGKSTVCSIFQQLGIALFEADAVVKTLYKENKALQNALVETFGLDVLKNNTVSIDFLRLIFKDSSKREQLNSIVHPFVFKAFEDWANNQISPYVIKEAAILFESSADKTVDLTIGVIAPEEVRLKRTILRDTFRTEEEIIKIMNSQLTNSELREKCDYIIENNEQESLIHQVKKLHQILLDKARHFA